MARKIEHLIIDKQGRDFGKTFVITEMSAFASERWATKAFFALANAGIDLPTGLTAGMEGMAAIGLEALGRIKYDDAEPLLAEMLDCVQIKPSEKAPAREILTGEDGDIEEITTLLTLRMAIFKLHVNFSTPDSAQTSALAGKEATV
jgi:hypothetical protein